LSEREFGSLLGPFLARAGLDVAGGPDAGAVGMLLRDRVPTLVEMADAAHYFYATPHPSAEQMAEQLNASNRGALGELAGEFQTLAWERAAIAGAIKAAATRHGLKPAQVMMPLRLLVAGTTSTPAIDAVLALVGRERTLERLEGGLGATAPGDAPPR
jgi:glutamyl-tRNA synthetase